MLATNVVPFAFIFWQHCVGIPLEWEYGANIFLWLLKLIWCHKHFVSYAVGKFLYQAVSLPWYQRGFLYHCPILNSRSVGQHNIAKDLTNFNGFRNIHTVVSKLTGPLLKFNSLINKCKWHQQLLSRNRSEMHHFFKYIFCLRKRHPSRVE